MQKTKNKGTYITEMFKSTYYSKSCRLCMSEHSLIDLNVIDEDLRDMIIKKIFVCLDIAIHKDKGLTLKICKKCEKKINKFYRFKQKCKEIDFKLGSIGNLSNDAIDLNKFPNNSKENNTLLCNNENDTCEDDFLRFSNKGKLNLQYINEGLDLKSRPVTHNSIQFNYKAKCLSQDEFQCEICGIMIKTKKALNRHIISHTGIKLFSCQICSKRFTRAEQKHIHMRSHMGIRPFVCEICGKSSIKKHDLIRHMRIHSDDRNYACKKCDQRFKRSGDLNPHMRSHTGIRPYVCDLCKKDYTSRSGLISHYKKNCKRQYYDKRTGS